MRKIITWIEAKIYRQVLLMVAISLVFFVAACAGEIFGAAGNLAGAAGSAIRVLWTMFGLFIFVRLVRKRKPMHCGCGNQVMNDSNFCTVCGTKQGG